MRAFAVGTSATLLVCAAAAGQPADFAGPPPEEAPAPEPLDQGGAEWVVAATAFAYFVPEERDYVAGTIQADRGPLRLEARINYEAIDTGSILAGWNLDFSGEEVRLDVTPMIGGAFGSLDAALAGYEITLSVGRLVLYTEGEFVFDFAESSDSFFYSWSELSYSITDEIRAGFALQKSRVRGEDPDFQPGLLLGVSFGRFDLTSYVFDSDADDPTLVFALTPNF